MASRSRAILNNLNDRAKEVGIFDQTLTLDDLEAVRSFYDFTCLKCGTKPAISIDHVKPLSKGGTNTRENLQLTCVDCNKSKGDKEEDYRSGKVIPPDFVAPEQEQNEDRRIKHDWLKLENEYITTNISQPELSTKYRIDASVIGRFASANGWVEKRKNFVRETQERMVQMVAQARAEQHISGIDLCDSIILSFMQEMGQKQAKITARDAIDAGRFREVLRGGVSNRTENVSKDWRDFAKDAGLEEDEVYAEFERIARERGQVVDGRGAFGSREQEEYGAGWRLRMGRHGWRLAT